MPLIHSFVNIFAGGRSEAKVFLFLIYLVTLFVIYKIITNKKPLKNLDWKWFGCGLLSLYLYGLFLQIAYTKILGVKVTDFIITGNNGELSSSTLSHTHVAKGFIGVILSKLGYADLSKVDAGGAYIGLIPNILFYIGSVLLILVLVQALYYFASSYYSKINYLNIRQKLFLIIGYGILSFSIIKTAIDGGLFNYGFYVSIIFIWAFYKQQKNELINKYYYLFTFFALLLLIINLFLIDIDPSLSLLLGGISAMILLYEILLYLGKEKIRLQFLVPIVLIFFGSWWQAGARDLDIYNYGENMIETGQNFYTYNKSIKEVVKNKAQGNIKIHKIATDMDKNESYLPITVAGITCMEKSYPQEVSMELLTDKPINREIDTQKNFISIKNEKSVELGGYWKTNLHIYMNPCLPEPLSVIDGMIRKSDINKYFIINPTFYDQTNVL